MGAYSRWALIRSWALIKFLDLDLLGRGGGKGGRLFEVGRLIE